MFAFLQIVAGFILLFAGSEGLVRGSVSMAISYGISRIIVGLTIIAFATSSPELFVGISASLDAKNGLVLGNMLGSNICNICLIIGVTALLRPIQIGAETVKREAPVLLVATLITAGCILLGGNITRLEGCLLIVLFILYNGYIIRLARREGNQNADYIEDPLFQTKRNPFLNLLMIGAGLALLVLGADILIDGAVTIARRFEISEAIIGLTLLAIGTSLPELAAALSASLKNESDLIVGNVIGSNLFNILCVLGVAAIISPIETSSMKTIDLAVFCGTGILLLPVMKSGYRISRGEGIILLAVYALYLVFLVKT